MHLNNRLLRFPVSQQTASCLEGSQLGRTWLSYSIAAASRLPQKLSPGAGSKYTKQTCWEAEFRPAKLTLDKATAQSWKMWLRADVKTSLLSHPRLQGKPVTSN